MRAIRTAGGLLALGILLAGSLGPALAASGPPYRDMKRGVQRQTDAAREASALVRKGKAAAGEVLQLLGDDSGYVRDAVFRGLLKWSPEDLALLAPGLLAKDEIVARNVAELLGAGKVATARSELETALKRRREPLTVAEILRALGGLADPASEKEVARVFSSSKDPAIAAAALIALTRIDAKGAMGRLEQALAANDIPMRIIALGRMAEIDHLKGIEAAVRLLAAEDPAQAKADLWAPRLLFEELDVLRAVKDRAKAAKAIREAVPVLVKRLGGEDGRARYEIGETLRELTGEWGLADEQFAWENWWQTNRERFDPAKVSPEARKEWEEKGTVVRYHGIPIYSKRLAFLLDLSGGMDRTIDPERPETARRLDYAKKELIATLKALDDSVAVNIFFFGSGFDAAAKELVPLGKGRRSFIEFVERQEISKTRHENRGNIYDPLVVAIDDPKVDTIFLLSEGNPTEGLYHERERFITHLAHRNRLGKTRIHALFIGNADSARNYVSSIAGVTGGRFYDVGERSQ